MFLRVRVLFGAIPLLYDSNNGDGAWIQYLSGVFVDRVLLEGGEEQGDNGRWGPVIIWQMEPLLTRLRVSTFICITIFSL